MTAHAMVTYEVTTIVEPDLVEAYERYMRQHHDRYLEKHARVRPARSADGPALARLRHEFRTALDPLVEPEAGFHARCAAWMTARLPNPDVWRCWVAEDAVEGPMGMVWVQFLEKLPNPVHEPELHAYLTSFYVRPTARNQGIGSALLDAALAACADRGVDTVFLWPTPRSRVLYLRHGFTERAGMLERRFWSGSPHQAT